jgi:serine/threonine protein kinase
MRVVLNKATSSASRKEYICKGSFGTIYKEYSTTLNKHIAAKHIKMNMNDTYTTKKIAKMVDREVFAWTTLTDADASYNSKLLDIDRTDEKTIFYSEFLEGKMVTKKQDSMLLLDQVNLLRDVANGIKECHDVDICHGDIKYDNTLFNTELSRYVLTDYGNSEPCTSYTTGIKVRRGTLYYMAPEIIFKNYGKAVDVWALGIFAYKLFTYGSHPFFTSDYMIFDMAADKILNSDIVIPDNMCTRLINDFLQKTLARDPNDRLDIYEVLSHPLLKL